MDRRLPVQLTKECLTSRNWTPYRLGFWERCKGIQDEEFYPSDPPFHVSVRREFRLGGLSWSMYVLLYSLRSPCQWIRCISLEQVLSQETMTSYTALQLTSDALAPFCGQPTSYFYADSVWKYPSNRGMLWCGLNCMLQPCLIYHIRCFPKHCGSRKQMIVPNRPLLQLDCSSETFWNMEESSRGIDYEKSEI